MAVKKKTKAIILAAVCVLIVAAIALSAVLIYRSTPQFALNEAGKYIDMGDYKSAIIALEEALIKFPDNSDIRLALSEAYELSGDIENALRVLTEYIESYDVPESRRNEVERRIVELGGNISDMTQSSAEDWDFGTTAENTENNASTQITEDRVVNKVKTGIEITSSKFPDDIFRAYIKEHYDIDSDNYLSDPEISAVRSMNINDLGISDVSGLQFFTEMVEFNCQNNNITKLHLSGVKNIDVSGCVLLKELDSFDYQADSDNNILESLIVRGCVSLESIICYNNQLKHFDANGCVALTNLYCSYNELETLDLVDCTALKNLDCHHNHLTSINIGSCSRLTTLDCGNNLLDEIDISVFADLEEFRCCDNKLKSLDIRDHRSLVLLDCSDNELSSLDATGCSRLLEIYCYGNLITGTEQIITDRPLYNMMADDMYSEIPEKVTIKTTWDGNTHKYIRFGDYDKYRFIIGYDLLFESDEDGRIVGYGEGRDTKFLLFEKETDGVYVFSGETDNNTQAAALEIGDNDTIELIGIPDDINSVFLYEICPTDPYYGTYEAAYLLANNDFYKGYLELDHNSNGKYVLKIWL